MPKRKATTEYPSIIAEASSVTIEAKAADSKGPRKFSVLAYTGGAMTVRGYELPIVVDLAGLKSGKSIVANLDHDGSKRVSHVTARDDDDEHNMTLSGAFSAATPYRDEVINSADSGFVWQASIEASPKKIETLGEDQVAEVNGQQVEGPAYIVRSAVLMGLAFVSHGADENTIVKIAASKADKTIKGANMTKELKAWIEAMGFDAEDLTAEQLAGLTANYEGRQAKPKKPAKLTDAIEAEKAEIQRMQAITQLTIAACRDNPTDVDDIQAMAENAMEGKHTVEQFELDLLRATRPQAHPVWRGRSNEPKLSNQVIQAAICRTARLGDLEKNFDANTLEAADQHFPTGIGIKQLLIMAAGANGYRTNGYDITLDVQRAAFGMTNGRQIQASGFSSLSIATILSNVANKFVRAGWMAVDQTPLKIAAIRSVRDFKTITTVSLTGDLQFSKIGNAGEIKHGTLGELSYTNKADTYGRMVAITREDIINDDLGALTAAPQRLGRGAMLKLNDIFWTEFLNNSSFFTSGNINVNTGVADMTSGGVSATDVIFMNQIDADSKPLGVMPAILLVPTALKTAALELMTSEKIKGDANTPDGNVWRGRFRVESSPYMSNSAYTGFSAAAWYMLADPAEIPVIEIVALNGRVEPTVETADADFNTLGIQMRGYSDVGVNFQEYRGGVRADGGAS